jgi:anti-anti-sigma factor
MRFDTLDIIIESRNDAIWLFLSGPFRKEQIPQIREKFTVLIGDGNRTFVVDLEKVTIIDDSCIQMFLQLLNTIKGKNGELSLVFKNDIIIRAFAPFVNIIPIYPDSTLLVTKGFFAGLKRRGKLLSRKTGIRISRPVALFLLFVISGWFISMLYIVYMQSNNLKEQQSELHDLVKWKQRSILEIRTMKDRLLPLEQLGILRDTAKVQ